MSKYVQITLEEIKAELPEAAGWIWRTSGGEHVAERFFKEPRTDMSLVVYTSINIHNEVGRQSGSDCIRVIGMRHPSPTFGPNYQPLTAGKFGRVFRVAGWRENLKTRVEAVKRKAWECRDWVPKRRPR